ncbi:hypothetical protein FYK61_21450 [Xanthomonas citri]|nr:hypothetical protein FYK61_21450 [Xanthomonas citri]
MDWEFIAHSPKTKRRRRQGQTITSGEAVPCGAVLREELEQGSEWSAWTASRPGSLLQKQVPWPRLCKGRTRATKAAVVRAPVPPTFSTSADRDHHHPVSVSASQPAALLLCCFAALLLCCFAALLLCCFAALLLSISCSCCFCSLHVGAPYRSGKAGRDTPQGGAHGCARFL